MKKKAIDQLYIILSYKTVFWNLFLNDMWFTDTGIIF